VFTPDAGSAIRLSLIVGFWCVLLGLPVALSLGWLLARREFPGKFVLSTLLFAPLVLPPVVTGLLLLRLFGPRNPIGAALQSVGIVVPFSLLGAVVASFVVGLPLYVLSIRAAIEAVDRRYEEVANSLGLTSWQTFQRITVPLALPGILAGAVLAFARALGEFGATAVLSGNIEGRTRTIALAVYALMDAPGDPPETAILLWTSLALSLGALAGYEALNRWQKKRLET
jgi:molybdate transport system permease protein